MEKPTLSLAYDPHLAPDILSGELMERLSGLCRILSAEPLRDFSDPVQLALLSRTEILLTGWGAPRLDAGAMAAAGRLRLVAHTGSSIKPLTSPEVWQSGVTVVAAASANAVPVAEYALAAILLANKDAFRSGERYRRERRWWHPQWIAPGETGNYGAVIGIIGASRTGRHLLSLLQPFSMRTLLYDPYVDDADCRELQTEKVSLEELLRRSDTISVHAPALPETHHMLGRDELAMLRDGAVIVNTARGSLIDAAALETELLGGRLQAVLDVTDPEPLPPDSPLFTLPNVFLTPHIAGAAGHETHRMTELAIDEIRRFIRAQPLLHVITPDMLARIG